MSFSMSNPPDLIVAFANERRSDVEKKAFDEFDDQASLLGERVRQEIHSIVIEQTELIEQMRNDASNFVNALLRQRLENLQSLRLLHQKEMNSQDENLPSCLEQQAAEMAELCENLLVEEHSMPTTFFQPLIELHRQSLGDLETSFKKKISYLNEIHSTTVEQLQRKHRDELDELQCELKLLREIRR